MKALSIPGAITEQTIKESQMFIGPEHPHIQLFKITEET